MVRDVLGVDLGNHEGHVLVEAEGVGVVHAHGTPLGGFGQERLRLFVASRAEHDVDALECLGRRLDDGHLPAVERDGLSDGAGAREGDEPPDGKVPLLEALEHLGSHDASGAENCNGLVAHETSLRKMAAGWLARVRGRNHLVANEALVDDLDGTLEVGVVDTHDDADLLGALRDHADVDARVAEDPEDLARGSRTA